MTADDELTRPLAPADVETLIGVLAILDGELMAGAVEDDLAQKYVARFVDSGVLAPGPDGTRPSTGSLVRAMGELIDRLRFALGEYDGLPDSASYVTAHLLYFDTEADAIACRDAASDALDTLVQHDSEAQTWGLYLAYPELSPDVDFRVRKQRLESLAAQRRGRYAGSQGGLPSR